MIPVSPEIGWAIFTGILGVIPIAIMYAIFLKSELQKRRRY